MNGPDLKDVPCPSCQHGYGSEHRCDCPDYCPCDQQMKHVKTAEARLAALRQDLEALADEWEPKGTPGVIGWIGNPYADALRAVLAEHAPSDPPQNEHHPLAADCARQDCDEVHYARRLPDVTDIPQGEPLYGVPDLDWTPTAEQTAGAPLVHRPAPSDPPRCTRATCPEHGPYCPGTNCCCRDKHRPAPTSADTEGVRLTEEEKSYGRIDPGLQWRGRWYSETSVERILAARLCVATEGKGEA